MTTQGVVNSVTIRSGKLDETEKVRVVLSGKGSDEAIGLSGRYLRQAPVGDVKLSEVTAIDFDLGESIVMPEWLGRLVNLRSLTIRGGSKGCVWKVPVKLDKLTRLSIIDSGLRLLPEWVGDFDNLRILRVQGGLVSSLPKSLEGLTRLFKVVLDDCRLSKMPAVLERLPRLQKLSVKNNPRLGLPVEILASEDPKAILSYYRRTHLEKSSGGLIKPTPLNEVKLVLVGRGGVGKTSLVHRLITGDFEAFNRTDGIAISDWNVLCGKDEVRAHIWDFGGQEIMHGTHRLFITSRSLYLVLLSAREGVEDVDADYWLSLVRSLAGDVPVLVVLNKFKEFSFEVNRKLLLEKFGRNIQFVECDAKEDFGMSALQEMIAVQIGSMPEVRKAFPAEWVRIKDALANDQRDWMSYDEFFQFCNRNGEGDRSACEELAGYLHDLGLMLSYRHDVGLREIGVLNPHWVTNGIYSVITAQKFREQGGEVDVEDFEKVLSLEEFPKMVHGYLLDLMRKFGLCFPLNDKGNRYLIPELLTKEEPDGGAEFDRKKCLGFSYKYDTALPYGLLPRFIVQTYVHRIRDMVWRNGVVLFWRNALALVRGDVPGRRVHIWLRGPKFHQLALLKIIRTHFERIHASYEDLPVTEMVPIPGYPSDEVSYAFLLKLYNAKIEKTAIEVEGAIANVSVKGLLDMVGMPAADSLWLSGASLPILDLYGKNDPLSLFISYSHRDELYRDELRGALTIYERNGELIIWDDTKIVVGQKWEPEILQKLEEADIVVLLVSNDFIKSDYCYQKEMAIALERHESGQCVIVPVIVRSCRFEKGPVGKIQAVYPEGKAIKRHRDRDHAWVEATKYIDGAIEKIRNSLDSMR